MKDLCNYPGNQQVVIVIMQNTRIAICSDLPLRYHLIGGDTDVFLLSVFRDRC